MRKLLLAAAAMVALAVPIHAHAKTRAPVWTECNGTLAQYKDGHYGLIADETDGTLCGSRKFPRDFRKS